MIDLIADSAKSGVIKGCHRANVLDSREFIVLWVIMRDTQCRPISVVETDVVWGHTAIDKAL